MAQLKVGTIGSIGSIRLIQFPLISVLLKTGLLHSVTVLFRAVRSVFIHFFLNLDIFCYGV